MIILFNDIDVWKKLAESFLRGTPKSGILVIEGHLIDDDELHWVKDMGGKKLLGQVKLNNKILTKVDEIGKFLNLIEFSSIPFLKRNFLVFHEKIAPGNKEVNNVTIAEAQVVEVESEWCHECLSVNILLLKRKVYVGTLPFFCSDCGEKFYVEPLKGSSIKIARWSGEIAKLTKRYSEDNFKKIPIDQEEVIVIAGEDWALSRYSETFSYFCVRCKSSRLTFLKFAGKDLNLFVCNRCGKMFTLPDQEGRFIHNKFENLKKRYPPAPWQQRHINRLSWGIRAMGRAFTE